MDKKKDSKNYPQQANHGQDYPQQPNPVPLERPGDPRFHYELARLGDLHDKKQVDYGTDNDPFANVRGSQDWGIPPWVGAMVRANDKVKRLQNFARKGSLANESAEDSFDDLAVYAIIGKVLYREASGFDYDTLIIDG